MRSNRKSLITPLFAGAMLLACSLLPAGSSSDDSVTVTSSDGVASLTYAPDGVTGDPDIQVTAADVPAGLEDLSGSLLAYDMQPSGLQFDPPATVRFEVEVNPDSLGVPLGQIFVEDDTGQAEPLETRVSRHGAKAVLSAPLSHFSRTYVWLATSYGETYIRVDPTALSVEVGRSKDIGLVMARAGEDQTLVPYDENGDYRYQATVAEAGDAYVSILGKNSLHCDQETGGVINDAYHVDLLIKDLKNWSDANTAAKYARLATGLGTNPDLVKLIATLSGHVECVDSGSLPTPTDLGPPEEAAIETPPVLTGFETKVEEQGAASCDFKPPSGGGDAILHGSDDGFVLSLYKPFGLEITGDGEGGLSWSYAAGPVGFGETSPRLVEVLSIERTAETLTLQIKETRHTDDYPEGCSRQYSVTYQLADETVLDFLESVPYVGSQGTNVENPQLEKGDGFFTLEGQFVNMSPGQMYHVWTQVSAAEDHYYLTPITPASDGTFNVTVVLDVSDGDWTISHLLVGGVSVGSTSGEW